MYQQWLKNLPSRPSYIPDELFDTLVDTPVTRENTQVLKECLLKMAKLTIEEQNKVVEMGMDFGAARKMYGNSVLSVPQMFILVIPTIMVSILEQIERPLWIETWMWEISKLGKLKIIMGDVFETTRRFIEVTIGKGVNAELLEDAYIELGLRDNLPCIEDAYYKLRDAPLSEQNTFLKIIRDYKVDIDEVYADLDSGVEESTAIRNAIIWMSHSNDFIITDRRLLPYICKFSTCNIMVDYAIENLKTLTKQVIYA